MSGYLTDWKFWTAVILVAFITNWAYDKFFSGKGQLV